MGAIVRCDLKNRQSRRAGLTQRAIRLLCADELMPTLQLIRMQIAVFSGPNGANDEAVRQVNRLPYPYILPFYPLRLIIYRCLEGLHRIAPLPPYTSSPN